MTHPSPLSVGQVHLWEARLDVSEPSRSTLERFLSTDERARASRFHTEHDRARFAVARGILRWLLSRYLDIDASEIVLTINEHGKPHLDQSLSSELRFNMSHSEDVALVAVACGRDVGVDVERVRDDVAVDDIARRFLTMRERAQVAAAPADHHLRAFFTAWTHKEAYLKGLGVGLGAHGAAPDPDPQAWTVGDVDVADGYVAAIALEGRHASLPRVAQSVELPD